MQQTQGYRHMRKTSGHFYGFSRVLTLATEIILLKFLCKSFRFCRNYKFLYTCTTQVELSTMATSHSQENTTSTKYTLYICIHHKIDSRSSHSTPLKHPDHKFCVLLHQFKLQHQMCIFLEDNTVGRQISKFVILMFCISGTASSPFL